MIRILGLLPDFGKLSFGRSREKALGTDAATKASWQLLQSAVDVRFAREGCTNSRILHRAQKA